MTRPGWDDLTPEEERVARELAAGPYGREKSRIPVLFATPIFAIRWTEDGTSPSLRNGTLFRLDLPERSDVGVTCHHVLKVLREFRDEDPGHTDFGFASTEANDLSDRIIDECSLLDLATIDLSGLDLHWRRVGDAPIGVAAHTPPSWPPKPVPVDAALYLGGFAEVLTSVQPGQPHVFDFRTLCHAGQRVAAADYDRYTLQYEREGWVGDGPGRDIFDLSGLSGSPAFICRSLAGVEYLEFVGIVCAFQRKLDLAHVRPAHFIAADGTLDRSQDVRRIG